MRNNELRKRMSVSLAYNLMFPHSDYSTGIRWSELQAESVTLNDPVFDGTTVWENASVVIENGVISDKTVLGEGEVDSDYFLMPGLIDAHTHVSKTGAGGCLVLNLIGMSGLPGFFIVIPGILGALATVMLMGLPYFREER